METTENGQVGTCTGCGMAMFKATDCQNMFEAALVRDFGDYRYAKVHRLLVDTYALQHPDRYMRSERSFAAHLTGMCAALEHDEAPHINRAVQRWLDNSPTIQRHGKIPRFKGDLTIEHISTASDPDEHIRRVKEWALSVWSAWSQHQNSARVWIDEAVERGSVA